MNEPLFSHLLRLGGRFRGGFLSTHTLSSPFGMTGGWKNGYLGSVMLAFFFLEGFGGSKHLITRYDDFG